MKIGLVIAVGVVLVLASLWLGAYAVVAMFPYPHWANFPSFLTAMFGVLAGGGLIAFAAAPK